MALKIDPEFKEALINLPEKEKDKYFLRLLKKDDILFHRLHFELVSDDTQDDRRNKVENDIHYWIENSTTRSAKKINSILRYLSGNITYHVRVTSDKFGEPYLNTIMIVSALKKFNPAIGKYMNYPTNMLNKYIIGRILKVLTQVDKFHADDQYEFNSLFYDLANLIDANPLLKEKAEDSGLALEWLRENDIPENIKEIIGIAKANKII